MARKKAKKSFKGLGAKYGATLRKKYTRVVSLINQKRQCPSCGGWRLKRAAVGIWTCHTCNYTMSGGAYDIKTSSS